MKKTIFILLTVFLLAGFCFGINVTSAAGPVKMKAISFVPKNHPLVNPQGHEWIKMINEALEGTVEIKYTGGPEVVPPKEQIEAVRNNVVQITMLPVAYYSSHAPSAATAVLVKFKSAMEMRKSDYHKYLVEVHEGIGVRYIGPVIWGGFYTWSKKPIKHIEDLKGMKMRSFFLYDRFQKALGIAPVNMPTGEIFTALERGVIDGFCFPLVGPRVMGLTKSAKYLIPYPFYANDVMFLMNLKTWNKLPKSAQAKIDEITAKKYDPYMMDFVNGNEKKEWVELAKVGVKKVNFPPEIAKKYVNTAYDAKWKEFSEKIPADLIQKLKKLTGN
jgi:TRAP-type C4-dicarboxylate transport system substrate-binding protein